MLEKFVDKFVIITTDDTVKTSGKIIDVFNQAILLQNGDKNTGHIEYHLIFINKIISIRVREYN